MVGDSGMSSLRLTFPRSLFTIYRNDNFEQIRSWEAITAGLKLTSDVGFLKVS